jgi:hypothetical protein
VAFVLPDGAFVAGWTLALDTAATPSFAEPGALPVTSTFVVGAHGVVVLERIVVGAARP